MAVKQKQGEDFSDEKILRVKEFLEKGETKKTCCDVLGIKYNTTRLAKIIQEFDDKQKFLILQKKKLRGTAVSKEDISYIVQAYLDNEAITNIADNVFRSTTVVKNILIRYGVPLRKPGASYFDPVYIENDFNDFKAGDLVFSARYNAIAEVIKKITDEAYQICVLGNHQQYAHQPYYELADLRKVQTELDIKATWQKNTRERAWQAVLDAQNRKKQQKKD